MPTIYDVTYSTLGRQLLPPDKRSSRLVAFVACLLAPLQWLRDLWMGSYRTGGTSAPWLAGTGYAQYRRVQYLNQVWESLENGNTGNEPFAGSPYWMLVQSNFIGLDERLAYNCQCIILTYALNKWFGATFRQPGSGLSDIYIVNIPPAAEPFIAGAQEINSSTVYANTSSQFVVNSYSFSAKSFTIYMPEALYAAVGDSDAARQATVKAFASGYTPAGLTYSIQTY